MTKLPTEIAQKMEAEGLVPQITVLMEIIEGFGRLRAEARENPAQAHAAKPRVPMWPLKRRLPLYVPYDKALKAANRGTLIATKVGGRWFVTDDDVQNWLAATGQARLV
jgi:hypothetical protein